MRVLKVKVISLPYIFQVLYVLCFTRPRYQVSVNRTIDPLVFISLRLMPVQYWSSVMFFCFVFSTSARLIKLPPVTAPGEILPF